MITEFSGESGTIVTSAGPVRFGIAACSGFVPAVGLDVSLMAFKELPIVGARATLVNLTGAAEPVSIDDRVRRDRERALAADAADWRIDDAASWLARHPDQYAADRFGEPGVALAMVQELLAAGAVHVALLGTGSRDRSAPNSMEIERPSDHGGRRRVFAVFEREWERYHEDFSASPDGRNEPQEITREQALAMGHPEAEGELVHDAGVPIDAGQTIMTLWWD
jgi:hypothetical protein